MAQTRNIRSDDQWVVDDYGNVIGVKNASGVQTDLVTASKALTGEVIKTIWNGTQAQYDAIVTKDASTLYVIVG